jgi:hypothetical protein
MPTNRKTGKRASAYGEPEKLEDKKLACKLGFFGGKDWKTVAIVPKMPFCTSKRLGRFVKSRNQAVTRRTFRSDTDQIRE